MDLPAGHSYFPGRQRLRRILVDSMMGEITELLSQLDGGGVDSVDRLFPAVYDELRRLAAQRLAKERPGHTLQPTALVHEVYFRLLQAEQRRPWASRGHFFAVAAQSMRRILVEDARRRNALKRGGQLEQVEMEMESIAVTGRSFDIIALDVALAKLATEHPRKAKLVDLRFFSGLSIEQAAEALGISVSSANRDWIYARAWLLRELAGASD